MRSDRPHGATVSRARKPASRGSRRTREPGSAGESPVWERVGNRILATVALAMFAAFKLSQTGHTSPDADRSTTAPTYAKAEGCHRGDGIGMTCPIRSDHPELQRLECRLMPSQHRWSQINPLWSALSAA